MDGQPEDIIRMIVTGESIQDISEINELDCESLPTKPYNMIFMDKNTLRKMFEFREKYASSSSSMEI